MQLQKAIGNQAVYQLMNGTNVENKNGLPEDLKNGIENLSGIMMDDVMVHYNSDKPSQIGALAYTQGNNIHVAPGQEKYLAHEAWHVVQQAQGRVHPTMQLKGASANDDISLENEADKMADKVNNNHNKLNLLQMKKLNTSPVIQGAFEYYIIDPDSKDYVEVLGDGKVYFYKNHTPVPAGTHIYQKQNGSFAEYGISKGLVSPSSSTTSKPSFNPDAPAFIPTRNKLQVFSPQTVKTTPSPQAVKATPGHSKNKLGTGTPQMSSAPPIELEEEWSGVGELKLITDGEKQKAPQDGQKSSQHMPEQYSMEKPKKFENTEELDSFFKKHSENDFLNLIVKVPDPKTVDKKNLIKLDIVVHVAELTYTTWRTFVVHFHKNSTMKNPLHVKYMHFADKMENVEFDSTHWLYEKLKEYLEPNT